MGRHKTQQKPGRSQATTSDSADIMPNTTQEQLDLTEIGQLQQTLNTLSHNHSVTDQRVETLVAEMTAQMSALKTSQQNMAQTLEAMPASRQTSLALSGMWGKGVFLTALVPLGLLYWVWVPLPGSPSL